MRNISPFMATVSLLSLALLTRFLPHFPNFTAIGAVALVGGFWSKGRPAAMLVPLALLFVSDLVLNNLIYGSVSGSFTWGYPGMMWVYAGHIAMVLWGQKARQMHGLIGAGHAVMANLVFFALSNVGFWYGNPALPQTGAGLFMAYVEAIPFFVSATASTLVYGALLQWAYAKRSALGMA